MVPSTVLRALNWGSDTDAQTSTCAARWTNVKRRPTGSPSPSFAAKVHSRTRARAHRLHRPAGRLRPAQTAGRILKRLAGFRCEIVEDRLHIDAVALIVRVGACPVRGFAAHAGAAYGGEDP